MCISGLVAAACSGYQRPDIGPVSADGINTTCRAEGAGAAYATTHIPLIHNLIISTENSSLNTS